MAIKSAPQQMEITKETIDFCEEQGLEPYLGNTILTYDIAAKILEPKNPSGPRRCMVTCTFHWDAKAEQGVKAIHIFSEYDFKAKLPYDKNRTREQFKVLADADQRRQFEAEVKRWQDLPARSWVKIEGLRDGSGSYNNVYERKCWANIMVPVDKDMDPENFSTLLQFDEDRRKRFGIILAEGETREEEVVDEGYDPMAGMSLGDVMDDSF